MASLSVPTILNADGTLPETLLLKLRSTATNLIDKGVVIDKSIFEGDTIGSYVNYKGTAPDLGCYEFDSASSIIDIPEDISLSNSVQPCFDMQGRRVSSSYRGLVIQNGRKYFKR